MKLIKIIFLVILIHNSFQALCQSPEIEWQNSIGGTGYDELSLIEKTSDGGYIVGGSSTSDISGDKTQNNKGSWITTDYWIVKINESGEIIWQKTIGGASNDELTCLKQTSDGGFICGGWSTSPISGNKTEDNISGSTDFWVLKLNSVGGIQWQNTIGGNSNDQLYSIVQTTDGGYFLGGFSYSGISGDKTEASIAQDYWVLKLDALGGIEWQNTIGGNLDDVLYAVEQTPDGGFILGGHSKSGISGDKTSASYGENDYWVVKLNAVGSIEWQKTIGGNSYEDLRSLHQTSDGGYILGGISASNISGDKSEITLGVQDYWVVKLSNTGDIEWENTISGDNQENLYSAIEVEDGGYILCGGSSSGIGGDKTEINFGATNTQDYWVVKLNASGIIQWERSFGGNDIDMGHAVQQTSDGGFIIGGYSQSDSNFIKTENIIGGSSGDFWIIKLENDSCIIIEEVCNSIDDNCNGIIDEGVAETITITAEGATTFCNGGSVILNATYSGVSVHWRKEGVNIPGATSPTYVATTKGTYSCKTSSFCDTHISNDIVVQVLKKPNAIIIADGPTSFCEGESVTLTANTGGGLGYQWYNGIIPIPGATNINYVATTTGNYKCLVTKIVSGCNKQSNPIAVAVVCKEGESMELENSFAIYPNPNSGTFVIESIVKSQNFSTTQPTAIEIYNYNGQLIFTRQINSSNGIINEAFEMGDQPSGIYLVKLFNGESISHQKLIID